MILIAGPCVWENDLDYTELFDSMVEFKRWREIDFYFKTSVKKENRTKISNYRGPGFQEGIEKLGLVKSKFGFKITTDFHTVEQIESYGFRVDMMQIPAFLATQIPLLEVAAKVAIENKIKVNIKKPQFQGPQEFYTVQALIDLGMKPEDIFLTYRGNWHGYQELIVDFRDLYFAHQMGCIVIVDITHPNKSLSYKLPDPNIMALILGRCAIVSGADGIFFEIHPDRSKALCDRDIQVSLDFIKKPMAGIYNLSKIQNWRTYH